MDSTRPLKVCCGIWHQDVSSRSFMSCKLRGGALHGSDLFVQHIPQMLSWIDIWGIWRPIQHPKLVVMLLKPFQYQFCFVARHIILLKEATAIREYCFHERVHMVRVTCHLLPLLCGPVLMLTCLLLAFSRGEQGSAFAPYMHQWALAAHDPVTGLLLFRPWTAFDRYSPLQTGNVSQEPQFWRCSDPVI